MKYSIEFLFETFQKHSKESEKIRKEQIQNFKENNPTEDPPEWMKDEFNFPDALASMCSAILDLQNKE